MSDLSAEDLAFLIKIGQIPDPKEEKAKPSTKKDEE
jgi:hypothetical protein